MQTFPLNYFSALRTPTQVFAGRKLLSWPKFFLIFVFLVSLMVMPVTLFYANQIQAIPLEQFLSVHSLIDEQGTQKFSELELSETGLQASQQTIAVTPEILVGVSLSEKQQSDHGTFIDFEKEQWVIQQKDKSGIRRYTMNYSPSFQPDSVRTPEDFQRFLEREFYASNRPTIILSYSLSLGLVPICHDESHFIRGFLFLVDDKKKPTFIHSYIQRECKFDAECYGNRFHGSSSCRVYPL